MEPEEPTYLLKGSTYLLYSIQTRALLRGGGRGKCKLYQEDEVSYPEIQYVAVQYSKAVVKAEQTITPSRCTVHFLQYNYIYSLFFSDSKFVHINHSFPKAHTPFGPHVLDK